MLLSEALANINEIFLKIYYVDLIFILRSHVRNSFGTP